MSATNVAKKRRQYSQEYLKYGLVPLFAKEDISMCLLCEKTYSNEAIKPAKMRDHLERFHFDKSRYLKYFNILRRKLRAKLNLNAFLYHLLVLIVKEV